MHKVFGHSWELIELNDGYGLGNLDESGLEGCNKILRKVRSELARKNSQINNLTDALTRLWASSDPLVNATRETANSRRIHKVHNQTTTSQDDALFKMLTVS